MNDITKLLAACVGAAVVSGALGALAGRYFGRRGILRRVRVLSDSLEAMMNGNYAADLSPYREGELSIMAGQLELLVNRAGNLVEQLAKDKDALKDTISDISHQLKTPLTALTTYLELLGQSEQDEKRRVQLARCLELSGRMNRLTASLLDIARLDSGTVQLHINSHNVKDTLKAVVHSVENEQNIHGVVDINAPSGMTARYDEKWLSQAVYNLLTNAFNHAGDPPEITVAAAQNDRLVSITVHDNGDGIDPQDLPHIFDRFYRAKNSRPDGLGIGLSLADSIVRLHHGNLRAVNQERGVSFIVTLPQLQCIDKTPE